MSSLEHVGKFQSQYIPWNMHTVLLCFVLLWLYYQCLLHSCDALTHILQGSFTGTGAILWLPQCQWGNPEGYGKTDHHYSKTNHDSWVYLLECAALWYIYWNVLHYGYIYWNVLHYGISIGMYCIMGIFIGMCCIMGIFIGMCCITSWKWSVQVGDTLGTQLVLKFCDYRLVSNIRRVL